jgi:hypothetical protein
MLQWGAGERARFSGDVTLWDESRGLNMEVMELSAALEAELNQIPGIICNGIFAQHSADVLLISGDNQVRRLTF